MQCFAYCRVSSEEQASDNHYSLANQEQKARDYAKLKGWRVAEVRKDVASGRNVERDGYRDLLAAIRSGCVDCVLVYRLDRLSRNVRDIYDFLELIREHDVAFVSLSEGFDTTTAMGRAMLGVAAVFAQLTREMIAENVRDGLMRRAQAGLYLGNKNGPFGYRYSKEEKTLIPVPEEAEVVRLIYSLFADRKWGVHKIVGYLNSRYVGTRQGAQWNSARVHHILRNPVYIGKVRWHEEVYDGSHDPILTRDAFTAVEELRNSRTRLPSRSHQSQHLLSGVAECGACGKRLTAHYGPKKKDGSRFVFYSHRVYRKRGECKPFYKSAAKLESAVIAEICRAAESDALSKLANEELRKQLEGTAAPLRERRQSIISELAEMGDRFNTWADRLDRGLIDEEQFRQQNSRLLDRKKILTSELEDIDRRLAECENAEVSFAAAREALSRFNQVWDSLEIEERRELVRLLVENMKVYSDRVDLKLLFAPEESIAL